MVASAQVPFTSHTARRDRLAVLVGLAALIAAAWLYLVVEGRASMQMSGSMGIASGSMFHLRAWTALTFGLGLVMWTAMMVAMMVPTAVPMTLVYAAVARKAQRQGSPIAPTFVFVAGYVVMWVLFSVAATGAQAGLDRLALLSPHMRATSPVLGSVILIAVGIYQLSPVKQACLSHCRAPAHFISQHWRPGPTGALRMGLEHGAYCLGCCWILMALLLVGGVMNLLWVAALGLFIVLEKTIPLGEVGGRALGVVVAFGGIIWLIGGFLPR